MTFRPSIQNELDIVFQERPFRIEKNKDAFSKHFIFQSGLYFNLFLSHMPGRLPEKVLTYKQIFTFKILPKTFSMENLKNMLQPPPKWQKPVVLLLGIIVGLGLYIFKISNAASYLSNQPQTCVNCHIMGPEYATWSHSAHREVATCNDCHVPHTNLISTYYFKVKDGFRHAAIFTLRKEPQTIMIKEAGRAVVQENCKRCHSYQNQEVNAIKVNYLSYKEGQGSLCWECHIETPHGRVKSLSATPYARIPQLPSPVPKWLQNVDNK